MRNWLLKICYNLSKLYNSLVFNDMKNTDKLKRVGIIDNGIIMLDFFNDKVEPKTEEEKSAEIKRPQDPDSEEKINYLRPTEMVRCIMI